MVRNQSPFQIQCSSCGQNAEYDIISQSYKCQYCGNIDSVGDVLTQFKKRKQEGVERIRLEAKSFPRAIYNCRGCGAEISIDEGEAEGTCAYCGGKLVRAEFTAEANMPWTIIPFVLTEEEALAQIKDWVAKNKDKPEAKAIQSNIHGLQGAYLPYQYVSGAVSCEISQDNSDRTYHAAGVLAETPVNTVKNLDNELLDAVEPFDASGIREFEFGYIAGQRVKLQDTSEAELMERTKDEIRHEYMPYIKNKFGTEGVLLKPKVDGLLTASALLPVYFLRAGKRTLAAVNGQTGRVAVNTKIYKAGWKAYSWAIEAGVCTVAALLITYALSGDWELATYMAIFMAVVMGGLLGQWRNPQKTHVIYDNGVTGAVRERQGLRFSHAHEGHKNTLTAPIFFEPYGGQNVPVDVHFYSPARIAAILLMMAVPFLLPLLLAVLVQAVDSTTGDTTLLASLAAIQPLYGAAWYCIAFLLTLIAGAKVGRRINFDYPLFERILPDGAHTRFEGGSATSTTALLKFVGSIVMEVIQILPWWFLLVLLLILLGSVAAMVS